jgi:hypothetical protein
MAPAEYGIVLRRAARRITPELELAVAETMTRAREIAQSKFGEYQRGWAELSESTIDRHGDTPLLFTGATRDTLQVRVEGTTGVLFSAQKNLIYSEYGTATEPPRPLMKESVREAMREVGIARMRFVLTRALAGAI